MENTHLRKVLSGVALTALLSATAFSTPVYAETLRMAWSQDATGLDPHKQTAFSSIRLLELIYEPLVRLDSSLDIAPAVADSWVFSADGMTLTFIINPNAMFQNGAAVTSADVKASFERVLDEETGAASRANFLSIASIDTPDAGTVVFNLSQPDVPMLTAMASMNAAIVPASEIAAGSIGTNPIGSGPFSLDSWNPNSKEVLVANPNWAGGEIGIDGIDISVLPDESAILAALRAGKIDFALLNDPLIATLVPNDSDLQLNRTPSISYHVLQLNPARTPMTELGVRQAISCAIDRQEILDTASLGEGNVTGPLVPSGTADAIISLEPVETLRYVGLTNSETKIITDITPVIPFTVATGEEEYPDLSKVFKELQNYGKLYKIDAAKIAKDAGALITKNIVMLGALAAIDVLPFKHEILLETILENVPQKFKDINKKAFEGGLKAIKS